MNVSAETAPDAHPPSGPEDSGVTSNEPAEARFRVLFDAHYACVWRFLRRLGLPESSADDAAQEVFMVAAQRFADILPGAERAFLLGTARRKAASFRRARTHGASVDDDVLEAKPDSRPNPEQTLGQRRAESLLDEVLDSMDPDIREAFVLFEIEGFPKSEVARLLEVPEGTAASRLRRGREIFALAAKRIRARFLFDEGKQS